MKSKIIVAVFSLSIGLALGFSIAPRCKSAPSSHPPPSLAKPAKLPDVGDTSRLNRMRERLATLERSLDEMKKNQSDGDTAPTSTVAGTIQSFVRNPANAMEELRKNDPERYAQITNAMHGFRMARRDQTENLLETLSSIDISKMPAAARKTHVKLQQMIEKQALLEEELYDNSLSADRRSELFGEISQTRREINRLNGEERKNLLNETVKMFGVEGQDASAMIETINEVIKVTDSQSYRSFNPRSRRRRR